MGFENRVPQVFQGKPSIMFPIKISQNCDFWVPGPQSFCGKQRDSPVQLEPDSNIYQVQTPVKTMGKW